jgi:hypothetical protein
VDSGEENGGGIYVGAIFLRKKIAVVEGLISAGFVRFAGGHLW